MYCKHWIMAKIGGNPQKFLKNEAQLAERVTAVRLPVDIDEFVRSLPNRTEWLRQVIVEAALRDRAQGKWVKTHQSKQKTTWWATAN